MTDAARTGAERGADIHALFALLKPRVMSLVVFTAGAGMLVAPGSVHPVVALASLIFIAMGAGASGALNMWWDADIDAVMRRTAGRPVPSGRVRGQDAFLLGAWLSGFSVVMLALSANLLSAGLLAFTIFFYAVIYTMVLKRRTPQNIVIGGAAGALPPVIGWAVVTGSVSVAPALLFLLIFLWTPAHFWALALFARDDYARAGVPMLTVTHGDTAARRQILVYALLLVPICAAIGLTEIGGPVWWVAAAAMNANFAVQAVRLCRRSRADSVADSWMVEKRVFRNSISYLFVLFCALIADAAIRALPNLSSLSWAWQ